MAINPREERRRDNSNDGKFEEVDIEDDFLEDDGVAFEDDGFGKQDVEDVLLLEEELSAKLLEYLESPHATTDIRLANKEQVYS